MFRRIAAPTLAESSTSMRPDHSTGKPSWSVRCIHGTPDGISRSVIRPTERTQTCRSTRWSSLSPTTRMLRP